MKIKLLTDADPSNGLGINEIVDAVINPLNCSEAYTYNIVGTPWYINCFELVEKEEQVEQEVKRVVSVKDLLGQEMKSIEFK